MKHWVYCVHTFREADSEGIGTNLSNNFVWSEILFGKFLGWPRCAEKLSFDVHVVADFEVWSCGSPGIRRALVTFLGLGDLHTEFLMELVKVRCKFPSTR